MKHIKAYYEEESSPECHIMTDDTTGTRVVHPSFPVLVAQAPEKKIIWVYQQVIVFKENTSSCSLSIYPAFILVHKDLLFGLQFLSL